MLVINVCVGSACHLKGAYKVVDALEKLIDRYRVKEKVVLKGDFCQGFCTQAVSVKVENKVFSVSEENVEKFFNTEILGRLQL